VTAWNGAGLHLTRRSEKSGMTKSENWPMWLSLPWVVVFIWMMLWTPKTKKGWYLVGFVFVANWPSSFTSVIQSSPPFLEYLCARRGRFI